MPVPHIPASRYTAELKKDARDMRMWALFVLASVHRHLSDAMNRTKLAG